MAQLLAVARLAGLATVFFDVAYQSYVPFLLERTQLHDANGKLGATQAFSQVAGPGLGGALFGLLKAGAMAADAISFGVSTATLLLIRAIEPRRATAASAAAHSRVTGRAGLRTELFAGLAFVFGHRVLRKMAACTATANLFGSIASALEILFLVRVVHVSPADTGLLFSLGSIGGILGGVLSGRLTRWIGSARIIWFSVAVFGVIPILMPFTALGWRLALFPIAFAGLTFMIVVYNIAQLSYRQMICPPHLLGRMNAAMRWIVWGTLPLGGLIGGALGSVIGIRLAILVGVVGSGTAAAWVFFSPLRTMRDIPDVASSASPDTQDREHDEDDRRRSEDAVADDDRDGKVPLRRNGKRGTALRHRHRRFRIAHGSRAVHPDPAHRHGEPEGGDEGQDGDRPKGEDVLVGDQVHQPQGEAAQCEQDVRGDNRHGEPGRRRALKVRVVLDEPDRQKIKAAQSGDDPCDQR
jgi:Transmembrane secretion effector